MVEKRKKPKFLRKDWNKKSKLGKRRKKKQVWRKPKGRHNKLREKRKGHGKMPSIGYSQPKEIRGKIKGLVPVLVHNVKELEKVKNGEIAIFASVGKKKKIEMAKKAKELNIKTNFDINKFLEDTEKELEKKREETERVKKEKGASERITEKKEKMINEDKIKENLVSHKK